MKPRSMSTTDATGGQVARGDCYRSKSAKSANRRMRKWPGNCKARSLLSLALLQA